MSSDTVWYVKFPAEMKDTFDKKAEEAGDSERGAAARQLRKFVKENLEEGAVE